jgi:lysophospholipase L1-like esterase
MALNLKHLGSRLLLIIVSTFVGLATAEIAIRVWVAITLRSSASPLDDALGRSTEAVPDSDTETTDLRGLVRASASTDLVYELKPELDCVFKGVRVRTNSHGMRNVECPRDKAEGVLRIAGLGDSVMFGWGVAEEETFLRLLEHRLTHAGFGGQEIEVLNFAVPGYNTAMEVTALREKALDFSPDVVVLHFVNNDFDLPRFMIEGPDVWSLRRSWTVDLIRDGWRSLRASGEQWHEPRELEILSPARRDRVRQRYAHLAGPEAFEAAMVSLEKMTRARSIAVVFVTMQTDGEPYAAAYRAAQRHGFHVVTVASYFTDYVRDHQVQPNREGWADTFWLSRRDPHPNQLGHRLFADAISHTVTPMIYARLSGEGGKAQGRPQPS